MAGRTVYGNSFSSNGWPMVDEGSCTWVDIPGTDPTVRIEIQNGQPLAILRAFVADINAYVEHVTDSDTGCWTAGNSVSTSNHLSGTAVDISWSRHPFRIANAGWNPAQIATIREIQDFYEGTVFWGNDWSNPKDAMHFQLASLANGGDIDTFNNPHTGDFIARKIRADGYSTFRRDDVPVPPPPVLSKSDGYSVLIIQEGQRRGITPRGIQIALATGLVESSILVYANEAVPASMSIPHDAVGSDAFSVGIFQQQVRDTGAGWWWGDAATCMDPTSSAGLFYDRLVTHDYNGPNSPGSYAQAVQSSAFPDRYDQRFNDAVAIYNRLANVTTDQGDDDLSAEAERMIKEMYDEYKKEKRGPSRGFFAPDSNPVDSPLGFLWNIDGNVWNQEVTWGYLFGVQRAEELVNNVAQNGVAPASWAGQLTDAQGLWLAEWGQQWCLGLISFRAAIQKAFKATGAVQPQVVNNTAVQGLSPSVAQGIEQAVRNATAGLAPADVQDIANRVSQQIVIPAAPAPAAQVPAVVYRDGPAGLGDTVKTVVDAVEQLKLSDALSNQDYATLAASIKLLEMKNGSAS